MTDRTTMPNRGPDCCVGSYARGEQGAGGDLDALLIVSETDVPFIERAAMWDLLSLPVPADVAV